MGQWSVWTHRHIQEDQSSRLHGSKNVKTCNLIETSQMTLQYVYTENSWVELTGLHTFTTGVNLLGYYSV